MDIQQKSCWLITSYSLAPELSGLLTIGFDKDDWRGTIYDSILRQEWPLVKEQDYHNLSVWLHRK